MEFGRIVICWKKSVWLQYIARANEKQKVRLEGNVEAFLLSFLVSGGLGVRIRVRAWL